MDIYQSTNKDINIVIDKWNDVKRLMNALMIQRNKRGRKLREEREKERNERGKIEGKKEGKIIKEWKRPGPLEIIQNYERL